MYEPNNIASLPPRLILNATTLFPFMGQTIHPPLNNTCIFAMGTNIHELILIFYFPLSSLLSFLTKPSPPRKNFPYTLIIHPLNNHHYITPIISPSYTSIVFPPFTTCRACSEGGCLYSINARLFGSITCEGKAYVRIDHISSLPSELGCCRDTEGKRFDLFHILIPC